MIRDTTAHRIASEWHSGQSSALYALSSSGAILGESNEEEEYNEAAREIQDDIEQRYAKYQTGLTKTEAKRLAQLMEYVTANGPRPAVPGWYENVIRKAYK